MSNSVIVRMMQNLINKKFYGAKEEAIEKLDVYFAMNRISEEEYMDLVMLAEEMYPDPEPEPTPEPAPDPEPETPVDPEPVAPVE
ncbi:hypothetical protein [Blautia marasmi]|uniref:hypothetical protein n=1 Tax=Blautia marasmi TaxID=1917868 RepID=UPI00266DAEA4|nr:hypothetical protein [Blautia marasmi]